MGDISIEKLLLTNLQLLGMDFEDVKEKYKAELIFTRSNPKGMMVVMHFVLVGINESNKGLFQIKNCFPPIARDRHQLRDFISVCMDILTGMETKGELPQNSVRKSILESGFGERLVRLMWRLSNIMMRKSLNKMIENNSVNTPDAQACRSAASEFEPILLAAAENPIFDRPVTSKMPPLPTTPSRNMHHHKLIIDAYKCRINTEMNQFIHITAILNHSKESWIKYGQNMISEYQTLQSQINNLKREANSLGVVSASLNTNSWKLDLDKILEIVDHLNEIITNLIENDSVLSLVKVSKREIEDYPIRLSGNINLNDFVQQWSQSLCILVDAFKKAGNQVKYVRESLEQAGEWSTRSRGLVTAIADRLESVELQHHEISESIFQHETKSEESQTRGQAEELIPVTPVRAVEDRPLKTGPLVRKGADPDLSAVAASVRRIVMSLRSSEPPKSPPDTAAKKSEPMFFSQFHNNDNKTTSNSSISGSSSSSNNNNFTNAATYSKNGTTTSNSNNTDTNTNNPKTENKTIKQANNAVSSNNSKVVFSNINKKYTGNNNNKPSSHVSGKATNTQTAVANKTKTALAYNSISTTNNSDQNKSNTQNVARKPATTVSTTNTASSSSSSSSTTTTITSTTAAANSSNSNAKKKAKELDILELGASDFALNLTFNTDMIGEDDELNKLLDSFDVDSDDD